MCIANEFLTKVVKLSYYFCYVHMEFADAQAFFFFKLSRSLKMSELYAGRM